MKKIIFIITIILLISPLNILFAQFRINYGIKGGFSLAHQTFVTYYSEASTFNRNGITAGIFIEPSFNKNISILLEVDYAQKGFFDEAFNRDYKLDCISIPLILKLKTQAGRINPYIQFGPRWDLILSHDILGNNYYGMSTQDFGITLGIGCETKIMKSNSILAEIRYNYDFNSDIASSGAVNSTFYYSRSFDFLVGVKFN